MPLNRLDKNGWKLVDKPTYRNLVRIESQPIYKIPDLKLHSNIEDAKRYIIFPYVKSQSKYVLINENEFSALYPLTYDYLCQKEKYLNQEITVKVLLKDRFFNHSFKMK